jgi:uncharacterized protein YjbJ (UPF0337 family)
MNRFTFDSGWNQIKGKLRQKYGQLTDQDLEVLEGKEDELLGRLQEKLGVTEEQLHDTLNELRRSVGGSTEQAHRAVGAVKAKASEVAQKLKSSAAGVAEDLRGSMSANADELKMQAEYAYRKARTFAGKVTEETEEYVRRKPREALFRALAAGFVVGLLIRR